MKFLGEKIDRLAKFYKDLGTLGEYPYLEEELRKLIIANCEELEREIREMYEKMDQESEAFLNGDI